MSTKNDAIKFKANALKTEWFLTLLFFLPGWVFFNIEGDISVYFLYNMPVGQFLYLLCKFCGLYAIVFLGLQLLLGLLASSEVKWFDSDNTALLHRRLGIIVFVLMLLHVGFFVTAVSLRNGHFAYQFLLPNFFESYYPAMVSLGFVAFCLLIITVFAGLMAKTKYGRWRWLHRLAWPAFFLVFFHSYTIGSETRVEPMPLILYLLLVSIIIAIIYRVRFALTAIATRNAR